jgi:NAD(P)-dependent dehydrogenase (short-subunit alcohol dehydrogenase family)
VSNASARVDDLTRAQQPPLRIMPDLCAVVPYWHSDNGDVAGDHKSNVSTDTASLAGIGGVDDEVRHRRRRNRLDTSAVAVNRVAVITGANRGIGLEVTRQLAVSGDTVVLGTRRIEAGEQAAQLIIDAGGDVVVRRLDVTDPTTLDGVAAELADVYGRLDILVNNAAIHYDTWQQAISADLNTVREALETNLLGAWRAVHAFLPLLRNSGHGRIVNVSSEAGSLTSMGGSTPAYNISKAALNALTRAFADDLRSDRILVNSVCPGWVATDMGGPGGRPVTAGAASIIWAIDLPDHGPTGGFYRDGRQIPW